jgi:phosphatidylglycerophosphate synthase
MGREKHGVTWYDTSASVTTPSSTSTFVVLMPGADPHVLGGSVRVRNARVAARVGATVVDLSALAGLTDGTAIVVPPLVLIDTALFDSQMPSSPAWLEPAVAPPGLRRAVLAGPVGDVASVVAQGFSPAVSGRPDSLHQGYGGPPIRLRHKGYDESAEALRRRKLHAKAEGLHYDCTDLPTQTVTPGALFDVSTATARRQATWDVLKRSAKPTDGWIARHLNRPISRVFSFVLLALGVNASHASVITLLVGLAAAVMAMRPGYAALVAMGLLFQLASVLDGVDGEIARATLTESEAGARLDAVVDQLTYVACLIGVTIGWAREGGGAQALFWMTTVTVALVLSLVRGAFFVARHAPDASFVFIDRTVRRAARESDTVALRMAAGGFKLFRRDLFALVFLFVSLAGHREVFPGLVAFGVVFANVTLWAYREELESAAVLERG